MRAKSASNAKPLPAVPWQSPAPFASGPARQVSSPPATRIASSSGAGGSPASEVTILYVEAGGYAPGTVPAEDYDDKHWWHYSQGVRLEDLGRDLGVDVDEQVHVRHAMHPCFLGVGTGVLQRVQVAGGQRGDGLVRQFSFREPGQVRSRLLLVGGQGRGYPLAAAARAMARHPEQEPRESE